MHAAMQIALEAWAVVQQMAPSLLFGFMMAGVLSVFMSPEFVERHLGRPGWLQIVKAAAFGVPLPLCSCSVIPVTASLRSHGASRGATLSFLMSTPQTGADSFMATNALLGPLFATFGLVTAFVSGILCGLVEESVNGRDEAAAQPRGESCCRCAARTRRGALTAVLRHAFVTLPREIGRAMLFGILLSGLLSALVPDNYFADKLTPGLASMFVMMLIGVPLYVCSSGSVPIALALIHMGVSPGAAFVFLVCGPATNAATVSAVWKMLGLRSVFVYLGTLAACSVVAGLLLDRLSAAAPVAAHHAHEMAGGPFEWVCAIVLLALLAPSLLPARAGDEPSQDTDATPSP